ncbi:MAG: hypothetical protein ACI9PX_000326 [Reinekea sp.]|jgi:hypothetical protein
MEINNGSILSYQKNQSMAGSVPQNGALSGVAGTTPNAPALQTDDVSISNRRDIFNWVAATFPVSNQEPASISRASQTLYDYQILNFSDLSTINQMISEDPEAPMISRIEANLQNSLSYQQQQNLNRIYQVFQTLAAAERHPPT